MRTTVILDPDVAAAVVRLQEEEALSASAALNELARAGLAQAAKRNAFTQRTSNMGARIDVANVAEALEVLEAR